MTTVVANHVLPSAPVVIVLGTVVKLSIFPSKLLSGLFQSTVFILRVHDCGFSSFSEMLSGLFELREIKAEMHHVSGKMKHNLTIEETRGNQEMDFKKG